MPNRDPHAVLGVERGASQETIKAAWRRLARMHHPDLTGDGPAAARRATRQMAEINTAYELLRDDPRGRRMGGSGAGGRQPRSQPAEANDPRAGRTNGQGAKAEARTSSSGARPGRQGPPRPKPSRPVTGRVDTTATFRARNQTITGAGAGPRRAGWPPLRVEPSPREPLRASDPTGPLRRGRMRGFRPPPTPPLEDALSLELSFGKFRGHTLGQVAAFEPSYIDWIAGTIARDPELVAAARVIRDDLDRRGVVRRRHVATVNGRRTAEASAGP